MLSPSEQPYHHLFFLILLLLAFVNPSSTLSRKDYNYGFSLSTFSPAGRLLQVDLASAASQKGTPCVAWKDPATGAVKVLTPIALPSPLALRPLAPKITQATPTTYMSYAGSPQDYRLVVSAVLTSANSWYRLRGSHPPVNAVAHMAARVVHGCTQRPGARPLGVSLVIAGEGRVFRVGAGGDVQEAERGEIDR